MYFLLITLLFLVGLGLLVRAVFDILGQKQYTFKNAALRRKQNMTLLTGGVGAILLLIALLSMIF
ncbi:hypothetical protein ACFO4N_10225 [Camelliibacillus cellulosilyticus]|uniref:Uncharacterized protein n=1 Tax=Camelliibacillus cellulosilyticus TaxID=2174486 RepID=A0ABV9GNF2_9BACL